MMDNPWKNRDRGNLRKMDEKHYRRKSKSKRRTSSDKSVKNTESPVVKYADYVFKVALTLATIAVPTVVCFRMSLLDALWDPVYNIFAHFDDVRNNSGTELLSADVLRHYDWTHMKPAGIYDPVDDRGFPYNLLNVLRPKLTKVDGRDIVPYELKPQKKVNTTARVYIIDDLLSNEECDILRALHDQHVTSMSAEDPYVCFGTLDTFQYHMDQLHGNTRVTKSMLYPGTRCASKYWSSRLRQLGLPWSFGTGFYPGESVFSHGLGKRIEQVTGFSHVNGAAFRIVSYPDKSDYHYHTDCVLDKAKGDGDRFGTVLVYLNDIEQGGYTYFHDLGISVKPKKGRALVWNNLSPDGRCDPTTLHKAVAAEQGTKYILQRWYVYQNYPGVEKRPPIPPIPERHPSVANVFCDDYRNGSCRWYDTWLYEVMLKY